jgi:hypothetical protein
MSDDDFATDLAYLHSLGYALTEHATPEHLHAIFDKWPGYIFDKCAGNVPTPRSGSPRSGRCPPGRQRNTNEGLLTS